MHLEMGAMAQAARQGAEPIGRSRFFNALAGLGCLAL